MITGLKKQKISVEELIKSFNERIDFQIVEFRENAMKHPIRASFLHAKAGALVMARNILKSIISEAENETNLR